MTQERRDLRPELPEAGGQHVADASTTVVPGALEGWLAAVVDEFEPPVVSMTLLAGGRSNLTYCLEDSSAHRYVLRRPPQGNHVSTAHDVLREARIIAALAASPVPVAEIVAVCDDTAVLGAPFFVMNFVEGSTLADPGALKGAYGDRVPHESIARGAVAVLASLHSLDPRLIGLDSMQRPTSYVRRQLKRLGESVARLDDDAPGLVDELGDRLGRLEPTAVGESLLHGDYKLANLLIGGSGDVQAVLDWELASTGDPLADLGWLLASWARPGDGVWLVEPATTDPGFPSRRQMAEIYAVESGREVESVGYYVAFALWRWSCINLGTRQRWLRGPGAAGVDDIARLDRMVDWQLAFAEEILTKGL